MRTTSIFLKLILLVALVYFIPGTALANPVRVASLNLCTDQLLLALADPEQIASITFLSRHRIGSYMAKEAANYPFNHGHAEELIPIKPDIVVSLSYSSPALLRLIRHLGFSVELFAPALNIADVMSNIKKMAKLIGQDERGERMVSTMRSELHAATAARDNTARPRGLIYEPNGYTTGEQTLRGDLMRIAGWHNIAAQAGITDVGVIGLEQLVLARPDRLILSPYAPGTHSLGQRILQHRAVKSLTAGGMPLIIPPRLWMCGGPMNVEAVTRLASGR